LNIDTLYDDLPSIETKVKNINGAEETKLDRMIGSLKLKDESNILVERAENKLAVAKVSVFSNPINPSLFSSNIRRI
jgi:hypothetical protein